MHDLKGSLRKILEATGATDAMTASEREEILDHLEDSVSERMASGMPGLEAAGEAFMSLGHLRSISSQFSNERLDRLTLAQWFTHPSPRSHLMVFLCILISLGIAMWAQESVYECYRSAGQPVPGFTRGAVSIFNGDSPFLGVFICLVLGLVFGLARKSRLARIGLLVPLAGSAGLTVISVIQASLPLVGMFLG